MALFKPALSWLIYELCHEKSFLPMRKQRHRSAVTAQLISAFVFATQIVKPALFSPKCQACSLLLWLPRFVCVGPAHKPRRPVFSCHGSYVGVSINGLALKDGTEAVAFDYIGEDIWICRNVAVYLLHLH